MISASKKPNRPFLTTSQAGIIAESMKPACIVSMREWVADCVWADDAFDVFDTFEHTDGEIVAGIDRHYDGGVEGFVTTWEADYGQTASKVGPKGGAS